MDIEGFGELASVIPKLGHWARQAPDKCETKKSSQSRPENIPPSHVEHRDTQYKINATRMQLDNCSHTSSIRKHYLSRITLVSYYALFNEIFPSAALIVST